MKVICPICPHQCALSEGQKGLCGARKNVDGTVIDDNYGKLTTVSLDPIEKKPLARFRPGSMILSAGSYGCNLKCPFCQNNEISMLGSYLQTTDTPPQQLVEQALAMKGRGNIGIAYTYNEPLVGYEYVFDCAKLARENGLINVVVTNGMVCEQPLLNLLPYIDAMNIDLKGFTQCFYDFVGGDLETVKNSIVTAAAQCHLEVTTLIVPGKNDTPEEMKALSTWLASINPEIPLHVSRFFPRFRMSNQSPTPVETVYALADIARNHLKYVYTGNC